MMKARILLVDDERSILMTLTVILQKNGFQVMNAASAQEAKEKLERNQFDLVITDLKMETDGADGLLEKPTEMSALLETISHLLTAH